MAKSSGIYKRGNTYWIHFSIDGRQYRESAKTSRKNEAEALLARRKTEIFENRFFPERKKSNLTIRGLHNMWLEAASGKRSLRDDRQRFDRVLEFFGEHTSVAALTAEDVDTFKAQLCKTQTRRGRLMRATTVNRHLALLRSALNLASKRGYHHRNPMAGVRFYREHNQRDRICSETEYTRLTTAADSELRLAIVFAYWTGMRLGEIQALQRSQVDLQRRIIRLKRGDTKEAAAKQIPLREEIVEALGGVARNLSGELFIASASVLSGRFRRLCRSLDISDLVFHDFRHTAATRLRRAGVDIMTIKAITGHKRLETLERYNKITESDLLDAINRL